MAIDWTVDPAEHACRCECGTEFRALWRDGYAEIDAAIDRHWREFDATCPPIDYRGRPLDAGGGAP